MITKILRFVFGILFFCFTNGLILAQEPFKEYYPNGIIKIEGQTTNEKRTGWWTEYYASGAKLSAGKYDDGEKTGIWKEWYASGRVKWTTEYPTGNVIIYDEAGSIKEKGTIKEGKKNGSCMANRKHFIPANKKKVYFFTNKVKNQELGLCGFKKEDYSLREIIQREKNPAFGNNGLKMDQSVAR
jgi:hypothetical protein